MTATGATSPGTMADDNTVGTLTWSNPNNAKVSDTNYTDAAADTAGVATTHYLKATNFNFAIPIVATINGILVEFQRTLNPIGAPPQIQDNEIKIVKADGTIGTTNKSAGAEWVQPDTYIPFGGAADLWNETWTAADINDIDFGVVISASLVRDKLETGLTAKVNHIRITIYYTGGAAAAVKKRTQNRGFL